MKKLINYIPSGVFSLLATAFVLYVLLSPDSAIPNSWLGLFNFKNGDKVMHVLLFMFLAFAYLYDYTKFKNPHHNKVDKELAFTVLAASLGLLTEAGQLAMGLGREFDQFDIVADVVGAFLAFAFVHWWGAHILRKYVFDVKRRHRRKKYHSSHHHHHSS